MDNMEKKVEARDLFQVVLDDDEQVEQVLRPHKGRAWFSSIVGMIVLSLFVITFGVCMIVFHEPTEPEDADTMVLGIVTLVAWAALLGIWSTCVALWCHKTVYAWTNKRVLIRTGYIGVDYKSLDLNMVGALSVNVNIVDKILRKNTGTIAFGSMASPMTAQNVSKFNFAFVYDPYRVYKEVKGYIDQKKTPSAAQ